MAKIYAVSGKLFSGSYFSSVIFGESQKDAINQLQKSLPPEMLLDQITNVDELHEDFAPINSSKAVSIAWNKQELLTVSFVFKNIKGNIKKDLIEDLNSLIAKYGF